MTDLTGTVAVVTRLARGIGKAIAQRFASLGASVAINYSADEDNARHTVAGIAAAVSHAIAVRVVASLPDRDRLVARRSTPSAVGESLSPTPARRP